MSNEETIALYSVAMATYNGMPHLPEQLESVLNQSYKHIEVIISDDGSTDTTLTYLEGMLGKDVRIKLVHNTRKHGIKENFANALQYCSGEYILLCDQDDYWQPEKIEKMVKTMENHSLVYHDSLFVDENGRSLNKKISDRFHCYEGEDPRAFLLYNCISGHAAMFKKELLAQMGEFPEARYHDWWLAFVAANAGAIKFLPEVLVHYRQHADSTTDLLKRKKTTAYSREYLKYKTELDWYRRAAELEGKHQAFFQDWLAHYEKREKQYFSPWLYTTIIKKNKILASIPRKNTVSMFFEHLKWLWGLRLKKLLS